MDLQLAIVAVLIAVAVLYIGLQVWRTWAGSKKGGCGGGCGCSAAAPKASSDQPSDKARISLDQVSLSDNGRHP
jgi:hypothetical protein